MNTGYRPANDTAHAHDAADLYNTAGIDWPVSADETRRAYGYIGARRVAADIDIWHAPNVAPKLKTQGIRPGDRIDTWAGVGTVTRVGSIAGFATFDNSHDERRWEISEVREIIPTHD
ncbi:MAG: hypothetical protein ACTH4Y_11620 [Microbacterium gubbeenense]|uniref:hypothetical protein n=1 Tax=Microbacterium gubbeenense TaxID=159896 RepID=UPI003F98A5A8